MNNDLTWGWVSTILAIVGVVLVIICICIGNWSAIPMCATALLLNVVNAVSHFCEYKRRKQEWKDCMTHFNDVFSACWPEDDPDDSNHITD